MSGSGTWKEWREVTLVYGIFLQVQNYIKHQLLYMYQDKLTYELYKIRSKFW